MIVGAGPSGCMAAVMLARRAWRVSLVEPQRFPRDKVCGEMLSALGLDVLRRQGLFQRLQAARPPVIRRALLHAANGATAMLRLPRPGWGLSRLAMDSALLDAAREAGVRVLQPARCEAVNGGRTVRLRIRSLVDNAIQDHDADCAIIADGKSAAWGDRPAATADFGLKAHFARIDGPPDAVELFGVRGHYVGFGPIEDDTWNLAMSVPAARLRAVRGDGDRLLDELTTEHPALARRLSGAVRATRWIASPLPRYAVRRRWPAGVIPVGNAAAAIEPIGGEGMGLALASAEQAADGIDAAYRAGRPLDVGLLQRRYAALWTVRSLACRAAARALSRPAIAPLVISALNVSRPCARVTLALLGKSTPHQCLPAIAHLC
jgi:2-polyprenyl-6-methoxyphenol hydroxylase-like FAD-dependent oxidoreductase